MHLLTDRFLTHSLRTFEWGERAAGVLAAAIQAVEPAEAIHRYVRRAGSQLHIAGRTYNLDDYQRVYLVGAGKAGAPMAQAAAGLLAERLSAGIVIVKEGYTPLSDTRLPDSLQIIEAGHPLPDERGVRATGQIIDLLAGSGSQDLVLCLISGGGSALLTAPVEGVSLSDLQELTSALLSSGSNIAEINVLRKHLDQVKGGGLARLAAPSKIETLILSDVVGSPLDVIASGPTVPDPSSYKDANMIIDRYNLHEQLPAPILLHLQRGQRGELPETPKPGDPLFGGVQNTIIGSNVQAAQAALEQAQTNGFNSLLLTTYLEGEARYIGQALAAIALQIEATSQPVERPACLIAGGETTVTLRGGGLGGRNQELALAAVEQLAGIRECALVTLATDGGDGPTDAAGAVASGETYKRASERGLNPSDYLARNDAYHFFEPLGDLIRTGPTRTNVNDLAFLFIE